MSHISFLISHLRLLMDVVGVVAGGRSAVGRRVLVAEGGNAWPRSAGVSLQTCPGRTPDTTFCVVKSACATDMVGSPIDADLRCHILQSGFVLIGYGLDQHLALIFVQVVDTER